THALLEQGEIRRVMRVAGVEPSRLTLGRSTPPVTQSAVAVGPGFEVRVPLAGVVDVAAETARIDKELARLEADLQSIDRKLGNPSFLQKAPVEVVDKDRARADELREKRGKLQAHRAMLTGTANPARRDHMENNNEQKWPETPGATPAQPAKTPAPTSPVADAAEKLATAATDIAKAAATAVRSGYEEIKERMPEMKARVEKAVRAARKKVAGKKKAKKAPRKAAARKAKKPAKRKAAARKPARKAKRKGRR
ncbi:MAG TPA: valine--tRNA ligase, partial [Anaeromyxobacteraceae bacterium]|nr:valine--tRNA ligase [Anaeromyxobacteraceae bacterium]